MKLLALIWRFVLDTLAPPDPVIRRIEGMDAAAFMAETGARVETVRRKTPSGDIDVMTLLPYGHELAKAALVEIKERENKAVAQLLGAVLYELIRGCDPAIVIPIPITTRKKRSRGWNQCELVAESLQCHEVRTDILRKTRETADQVGKGRTERFENVRGTFSVANPSAVFDRHVIVFDDIVTTGATLSEARRALLDAGVKSVTCAALAH